MGEEQKKLLEQQLKELVNFLSSLDEKIAHVSQQLNSTKEFKKGLLQKIFV